jgi:hypothetical protein
MLILAFVDEHESLVIQVFKIDEVNARIIQNFG